MGQVSSYLHTEENQQSKESTGQPKAQEEDTTCSSLEAEIWPEQEVKQD